MMYLLLSAAISHCLTFAQITVIIFFSSPPPPLTLNGKGFAFHMQIEHLIMFSILLFGNGRVRWVRFVHGAAYLPPVDIRLHCMCA